MSRRYLPLLMFAIFLATITVARVVQVVQGQFDGLYGQDPYAYYAYATGPLRDSILALAGPPPFHWPPGYPYFVALASFLTGRTPLAGQVVSLVAGVLVPIFTYLLATELWPLPAGKTWGPVLAGLLVAFQGQLGQSSVVVMSDTLGLTLATGSAWALVRYARPGARPLWLWAAAAAMAGAVLTRWAYALVAIPITLFAFTILWQQPRRTALVHGAVAAGFVLLVMSPLLQPVVAFLYPTTETDPAFVVDLQVYRWSLLNAFRNSFETADGRLLYRFTNGLYYLIAPAHRYFFTPLLAWLIIPGLWATWRQRTTALLLILWGWAGIVFLFHAGAPWQNFRFTLAYLPPLAILAAIGAGQVLAWLENWRQKWSWGSVFRPVLVGLIFIGLLLMAWGGGQLTQDFITRKQENLALIDWVEEKADPDTRLLTFNLTLAFQQYSDLETRELFYESPISLAELATSDLSILLLIDVDNVESQWAEKAPGENYRWLRDSLGLSVIGKRGAYTLFTVRTLGPAGEG